MAEIFELDAYRPDRRPEIVPPLTRNQKLLAEIQAKWAARTPEEIRLAEFLGTKEELDAVQRRYDRLAEAMPPHPWPSEVVKANRQAQPDQQQVAEKSNDRDSGHSM